MVEWTSDTLQGKKQAELRLIAETLGLEFDGKTTNKVLRKLILGYYGKTAAKKKPAAKTAAKDEAVKDTVKRPVEKLQEAPKWPSADKVSAAEFRVWRREVDTWVRVSAEQGHSDDTMFVAFMRQLPHSVKEQVYAELDTGAEHVALVMEILARDHGGLEAVVTSKQLHEYRNLRRKKEESLTEFLTRYRQLRAKVVNAGQVVAQAADVTDLLLACQLDITQHSAILSSLRREKGLNTPELQLTFVLEELKALEEMYALREDQGVAGSSTEANVTLFADKPDWRPWPKGKGKDQTKGQPKGQPKGKPKGKAKGLGKTGNGGKHDKGAKGQGKGKQPCWEWQKTGTCWYGDSCRFAHEEAKHEADKRKAGDPGGPAKRKKY